MRCDRLQNQWAVDQSRATLEICRMLVERLPLQKYHPSDSNFTLTNMNTDSPDFKKIRAVQKIQGSNSKNQGFLQRERVHPLTHD